jgi:uracil-DNA glycosylase family 4
METPVPFRLSNAEAAQGAQSWLRMLAQAGVTVLPPLGANAAGSATGSVDPTVMLWQEMIGCPEAISTKEANPGIVVGNRPYPGDSGPDATNVASVVSREKKSPATDPLAGSTTTSTPTKLPESIRKPEAQTTKPTPSPQLKSFVAQPPKAALVTYPNLLDPERVTKLQQLEEQVKSCTLCADLVKFRRQPVFGVGNIRPRLVMMGEAPGADEDRMGEPFVGASGQLLDKIIAAMKLRRQDVYILNTVKCRPPQNRNPTDSECQNCRPFWEAQLELLQPEVVVCLGSVASKTLLQTTQPVGQLRGLVHDYRGAKVVVTYHPSYLLRTESAKRQTWEDMKVVMNLLGLPL